MIGHLKLMLRVDTTLIKTGKDVFLSPQQSIFGRNRFRDEENDEELSDKTFYIGERNQWRVWSVGARSISILFRWEIISAYGNALYVCILYE